ncbi:Eukaryotic translation initiation factor 3 subunit G [Papilio machaon]|uniref:Eukaryotic translation initiation factor 3 subunit G n=1 Tax=Papilio machaon TaxID=76193 RepID=A0A0N1IBZ2_PAPMA|nr:Eukaryotic translation initiation factor 3 subunit G [Papilio machaon]
MANRSWSNQSHDWDPMRDDYNNSTFDPQYPDDNAGNSGSQQQQHQLHELDGSPGEIPRPHRRQAGGVQLDQSRLYITNIPKNLNEDGLRTVFAKYGTLKETFLSRDQNKRYGLIKYETPGEAKLAMMKLNRTEPLRLVINIAHKVH